MLDGLMLMWFIQTGLALGFVIIDIRHTPEALVMKWAFVILVAFTGPLGAFFYVLGCREPIPGRHAEYVAAKWRQVLGSTMHCAAGDGVGIIAGAAIGSFLVLPKLGDIALEYALGFSFGWAFFQSFAMRDMAGGSYLRSLRMTFLPEFLSMNILMSGMVLAMAWLMPRLPGGNDPTRPGFWFVMSMSLVCGFICAYPMNWWLVSRGLKHGMFTIRAAAAAGMAGMAGMAEGEMASGDQAEPQGDAVATNIPAAALWRMALISVACFALAIVISRLLGP
jgi:Domain of unknown function (DUF4396)